MIGGIHLPLLAMTEGAYFPFVDLHRALRWDEPSLENVKQRSFPLSAAPHDCDFSTTSNFESDAVQDAALEVPAHRQLADRDRRVLQRREGRHPLGSAYLFGTVLRMDRGAPLEERGRGELQARRLGTGRRPAAIGAPAGGGARAFVRLEPTHVRRGGFEVRP